MENSANFQHYLQKSDGSPVPLAHNFYEGFFKQNQYQNVADETASTSSRSSVSTENAASQLVKNLLEDNQKLINEAAMRQAASSTLKVVNNQQFQNLTPLSFDHEQFIQEHEAAIKRK